jgi:transcriptional regulator with XRE-family HTH domain
MAVQRLENYLRTHRRQAGLSQDQMAYLLGARDGTKISRYERFARTPTLETALAYEAILGTPVRELFAGAYARAERTALRRARLLKKRLAASGGSDFPTLKILCEVGPQSGEQKLAA